MTRDDDPELKALQQRVFEQTGQRYSAGVIDHWINPRNPGPMGNPDGQARVESTCGDTIELFIRVEEGRITHASFTFDGCLTTMVSASVAVELLIGKEVHAAIAISQEQILEALGGLPKANEHCALHAADAVRAVIRDYMSTKNAPWRRFYRRGV